jgi:hypothetical protein
MRLAIALSMSLALWVADVSRASGQPGAPLPDQSAFFAKARTRLVAAAADFIRFSHMERSTEMRFNPFGNLGAGPTVLMEVFPAADDAFTYRRVLERGGKKVSDLDEQDRKYRARLDAHQREVIGERPSTRAARLKAAEIDRARQEANVRETLELFTFDVEERTTWAGEPAIIVRFTPKPGGQARTREARIAKAFAGRVWVQEHEYDVMYVEATAIDDVSFGMGLIGRIHKGSSIQFTRQRLHGTWLPLLTVFKGSGRVLLRWVDIDFRREYFDYRPYDPADLPARLGWTR